MTRVLGEKLRKKEKIKMDPTISIGVIDKCVSTRIYKKPSILSDLAGMLSRGSEVLVENDNPASHFCKVTSETGIEGYCMRPFIKFKEEQSNE